MQQAENEDDETNKTLTNKTDVIYLYFKKTLRVHSKRRKATFEANPQLSRQLPGNVSLMSSHASQRTSEKEIREMFIKKI